MSMQDPISDMLTRIRNGQDASKRSVTMPASKKKITIAKLLKEEGYITNYSTETVDQKDVMTIELKYLNNRPVIDSVKRFSKPSRRMYRSSEDLPVIQGGYGILVVSTSRGVMTDRAARKLGIGGEILCAVY